MVLSLVQVALGLVGELLPQIGQGSTTAAAKIVATLEQIVPAVVQFVPTMVAEVQDIIAAVQSSGPLTDAQMTSLETMAKTLDDALVQAGKDEGLTDPLAPPATPAAS
jgi:hypothetical protein